MRTARLLPGLDGARLDRNEIAGSLGDLGTFLPLLVAMSSQNGLDFGTGLFFSGFFNVVTGLAFSIPMAVQPMKAIAAVALTEGLAVPQIVAAGATVSAFILLLGITRLVEVVNVLVPRSAVRGVQLAVGLSLLMKGVQMVTSPSNGSSAIVHRIAAAIAVLVVLVFARSRTIPAALVLVAGGIALVGWEHPAALSSVSEQLWLPHWRLPRLGDVDGGVLRAALPQLPLTTLNSVVAVCALSADLFPGRPAGVQKVSVSVGLMNLVGAPFGAMPMCHGAGGLAGQYKFGARTSGSILFLGVVKMATAVAFGGSMVGVCRAFPSSVLGVMLAFSGAELALVARDQNRRNDALVMIATTGISLALNNVAIGFVSGVAIAVAMRLARKCGEGAEGAEGAEDQA